MNEIRRNNGLSEFKRTDKLDEVALLRAWETTIKFSHTRPNGSSCFTALKQNGISYSYCGENIAVSYTTPAKVVNAWMNSSGHRKNILNPNLKYMGVGFYRANNGDYYWVQMFYC